MVISRPEHAGTDLEGESSNPNLVSIKLETPDVIQHAVRPRFRSRLTAEDLQGVLLDYTGDPATWTDIYNPLFIVSAEATYP